MDLSRTQLTGLFNNMAHEKSKYVQLLYKIKSLLELNKDNKLILTTLEKLILTSSPTLIYQNISFSHPLLKILTEILEKTIKMGNGEMVFINILKTLIPAITHLVDNGIKAKGISDAFKDLQPKINKMLVTQNIKEPQCLLNEQAISFIQEYIGNSKISALLVEAINNTNSFSTENIRICKVGTGSTEDSYILPGMLLNREPESKVKALKNTSVGIFNCPFDINRTELKGTVLMHTADELINFSKDEVTGIKNLVDTLNVNVVIVCGNVNELFLDFANNRNILVLRVFNKFDLKRLSELLGTDINTKLGPITNANFLKSIEVVKDGNLSFTKVIGSGSVNTIVLKNTMSEKCNEIERKIVTILETLEKNEYKLGYLEYSEPNFYIKAADLIGNSTVIHAAISESLKSIKHEKLILSDHVKCLKYALEFFSTILEVDDYLVAKADHLNIKPRDNKNWDDD